MPIKYIVGGDEFKAKSLLGEGRHQLSILKNTMSFQKLKQLERMVALPDGTQIKCSNCFGLDIVNVFAPEIPITVEEIIPIVPEEIIEEIAFRFKLTRGDGVIVGGFAPCYLTYSRLYKPDPNNLGEVVLVGITATYDSESQYWTFRLSQPDIISPSGYWVVYNCNHGVRTQYPSRYIEDDWFKTEDLIPIGDYEDTILFLSCFQEVFDELNLDIWEVYVDPESSATVVNGKLRLFVPEFEYVYAWHGFTGEEINCVGSSDFEFSFKLNMTTDYYGALVDLIIGGYRIKLDFYGGGRVYFWGAGDYYLDSYLNIEVTWKIKVVEGIGAFYRDDILIADGLNINESGLTERITLECAGGFPAGVEAFFDNIIIKVI
jgi:hypothetical protein